MSAVDTVLSALRAAGKRPRKAGEGWSSCCPGQDDRSPSLSVSTGADGRALVKCHAGCAVKAVGGSLGLEQSDLFGKPERTQIAQLRRRPTNTVITVTNAETPPSGCGRDVAPPKSAGRGKALRAEAECAR